MTLLRTNSDNPDFRTLVSFLDQDLAVRNGEEHAFYAQFNKVDKINHAVVAFVDNRPVGCGAIRAFAEDAVEVKRMYVLPEYRRLGIAGALLAELEDWTNELGLNRCILETGKKQPEAIRLYQKYGYKIIANYGPYQQVENSLCMEKMLNA